MAIALFGHILLVISSVPGVIEHPNGALTCFVIALVIMGIGTGGFKPNISPLVAEQYKKTKLFIRYTRSGEKVIVDPSLTTSRIYMVTHSHLHSGGDTNITTQVLLSVHQYRCVGWPDWYDLLREGATLHRYITDPQAHPAYSGFSTSASGWHIRFLLSCSCCVLSSSCTVEISMLGRLQPDPCLGAPSVPGGLPPAADGHGTQSNATGK